MPSRVPFCSLQVLLLLATQWPVKSPGQLLEGWGSPLEALQLHSNTQSHWSSRSTICIKLGGAAVRIPQLQWNRVPLLAMSRYIHIVPDTASYIRGWMQMVLTPNDLFSWNNKYSKYTIILSHIHYNEFTFRSPAMRTNSLCACWHSEAVKESSSSSSPRLLISLWVTSSPFLCPELTDAPCHYYGGSAPLSPIWRPHPQGPHTLPS